MYFTGDARVKIIFIFEPKLEMRTGILLFSIDTEQFN